MIVNNILMFIVISDTLMVLYWKPKNIKNNAQVLEISIMQKLCLFYKYVFIHFTSHVGIWPL